MHPLLDRQLRSLDLDLKNPPNPHVWRAFVRQISAAYEQADQERKALGQSLALSSNEVSRLYDDLRTRGAPQGRAEEDSRADRDARRSGVLESIADAILVVGSRGEVLDLNRRFVDLWRVPQHLDRSSGPGLLAHVVSLVGKSNEYGVSIAALAATHDAVSADDVELADGRIIHQYSSPVHAPDGASSARVWCFRDVTEERRLAAYRAVAARMDAVGQMVATVAHEINNPLAYIGGNVAFAIEALDGGSLPKVADLVDALEDARAGVDKIKVIVRDLRAVSHTVQNADSAATNTPSAPPASQSSIAPCGRARRSILVVDDDDGIRRWFERALDRHEVTTVASVDEAEGPLATRSFDVIFCDLMMAGRTGLDMHVLVKTKRPALAPRVIFMTGGAFTPTLASFLETVPNLCLKKPFEKRAIERAIDTVVSIERVASVR